MNIREIHENKKQFLSLLLFYLYPDVSFPAAL